MTYKVQITQDLIDLPGCPIEHSIANQTSLGAHVGINSMTLWAQDCLLPKTIEINYNRALDFIKRRDQGKCVKPFEFQLKFWMKLLIILL